MVSPDLVVRCAVFGDSWRVDGWGSIANFDGSWDVGSCVMSLAGGFNAASLQRVRAHGRSFLDDGRSSGNGHRAHMGSRSIGVGGSVGGSGSIGWSCGISGASGIGGGGVSWCGMDYGSSVDDFGGQRGVVSDITGESVAGNFGRLSEDGRRSLVDGGDRRMVDWDGDWMDGVVNLLDGVKWGVSDEAHFGVRHNRDGSIGRGAVCGCSVCGCSVVSRRGGHGTAEHQSEHNLEGEKTRLISLEVD